MHTGIARRHKRYKEKRLKTDSIIDDHARELYRWRRQVMADYHRQIAFTRLGISKHGILYGKIYPEHNIEDMVLRWFAVRFPAFYILMESKYVTYKLKHGHTLSKYRMPLDKVLYRLEKSLPLSPVASSIPDDDLLWEKYYNSQSISRRKNLTYFHKNLPKKCLRNMDVERRSKNASLLQFQKD